MIRTKIIATMGPAVADVETLLELFRAGCDVCRLNFSHGTFQSHLQMLRNIREASLRHPTPIAVLGDLCGPKIRLGKIPDLEETGGIPVKVGGVLILQRAAIEGRREENTIEAGHRVVRCSSNSPTLNDDVQVGHRVFIEDGMLRFLCIDKTFSELRLQCTVGGVLKSNKGINLPDTHVNVPSITDHDWQCVDWAVENDLDYLALSFVRSPDDIKLLHQALRSKGSNIQIIAKIEKSEAVAKIDEIIDASHGLMVARGDLGVEVDVATVPIIQKDLIRRCARAAKPVIVATQMLQSMIENASPTRAEVSDVANAIFDGTDAVMLSGETSVGKFPVVAVHTMAHIAGTSEDYQASTGGSTGPDVTPDPQIMPFSSSVAHAVARLVHGMDVKLVVVYSQTGATARIFSKHRFAIPIVALSSDNKSLRQMALHFGVQSMELPPPSDMDELVRGVDALVLERGLARRGDRIVVVGGASLGTPGTRNAIILHTLGADVLEDIVP